MSSQSISFQKTLCKNHTSIPFQLAMPKKFCEQNLPCENSIFVLVDEYDREYSVNYLVKNHQLGLGWKGFVTGHGLLEGDDVLFHLISPCKFKVYIKRTHGSAGTNDVGTGKRYPAIVVKSEDHVVKSCATPSLPTNTKKRSPETYLVGPNGKIRPGMDRMVKLDCGNILRELMKHSYGWIFNKPVDPVKLNIPDYFTLVSEPMDLGTIKHKLDENRYSSMEDFTADVRLTFSNAMWYNPPEDEVNKWAKLLSEHFNKKLKSLEAKLKHQRSTAANGQDSFDARAGLVNPVKMEKNESQFMWKNIPIAKCHLCGDLVCHCRETDTSDPAFSCEHTRIVKNELPPMGVRDTMLLVSDCHSTPLASIENSETNIKLQGFEDFKICVNGEVLDSEIPLNIRIKYYQLCCGQKKFIHERVMKGLNSKLVVAMILEIVSITDAMKSATISTSPHDLECMEKALKSFQDLGMAVQSLRAKISTLTKFSTEHLTVEESTRVKLEEIVMEKKALKEKKSKIDELIQSALAHSEWIEQLEMKIDDLNKKKEKLRFVFKGVTGLTW